MKMITRILISLLAAAVLCCSLQAAAPRFMEKLGRGVVAIHQNDGNVFLSWRMLGTDPDDVRFNVYRTVDTNAPAKLNNQPLAGPTHFVDKSPQLQQACAYFVRPVIGGAEQEASAPFKLPAGSAAQPYLSVPLQTPEGYTPQSVISTATANTRLCSIRLVAATITRSPARATRRIHLIQAPMNSRQSGAMATATGWIGS
jgi:Rhamnogalacturonan I lyases beta-sheet domain